MRDDAYRIMKRAIDDNKAGFALKREIDRLVLPDDGRLTVISVGKAAWEMALAAKQSLKRPFDRGLIVTKYGHSKGVIEGFEIIEAGHPISDENSVAAAETALEMTRGSNARDTVLFLLSGGGSALFEKPLLPLEELNDINRQLLFSGADINEINTVRKRLSAVKAGRFALNCAPARVIGIMLSDVLGDRPDTIASGPTCADESTVKQAVDIVKRRKLNLSPRALKLINTETPKRVENSSVKVIGSVRQLCESAARECEALGYDTRIVTCEMNGEARVEGKNIAEIAKANQKAGRSLAFVFGGETVVHVKGKGLGGRNQELALSAAKGIAGLKHTCVFSVGSDGTDGPTDAAGAYADDLTMIRLAEKGISADAALDDNDSYHALKAVDALIFTGPTGTNVNDLSVLLIKR